MTMPVFPVLPSMDWNSKKKQTWNTRVQKSGSGKRKTMTSWAWPEYQIECSYKALKAAEVEQVAGFCGLVRGALQPFLWLDPEDYQETKVRIGSGNGNSTRFQLLRNWGGVYVEPVRDIVPGSLTVYINDAPATVTLLSDGLVEFTAAPSPGAVITATFQYYWRVAFADDDNEWTNFWYGYYKLQQIKLVTVR